MAHRRLTILGFWGASLIGACSASDKLTDNALGGGDASPPAGSGAANGTGGTTSTGGQQPPPPETENDNSYTAPVVSGRWIWSANPLSGKVALIDAATFRVTTADAGLAPTYVAALGTSDDTTSSAIVLNVGNDTASVLHAVNGVLDVQTATVHPGANRMTVSASGRWAIVWSDASLVNNPDPTEGLQDVTVLDLGVTPAVSYRLTVGYRPSRVSLGAGETHAYFVTEPGISVIDLPAADPPSVSRDVMVAANPQDAQSVRDVTVTPDGSAAIVRHEGSPQVDVISLADGKDVTVTLPGAVTDLDLAPGGKVAFAVVRSTTISNGNGGSSGSGNGGRSGGAGTSAATGLGAAGIGGAGGTSGAGSAAGASGTAAGGGDGAQAGAAEGGMSGAAENGMSGAAESGTAGQTGGSAGTPSEGGAPSEAGAPGSAGFAAAGSFAQANGGNGGNSGGTTTTPSYVAALDLAKVLKNPDAFSEIAIDDQVGSIVVAPEGDVALLYTNATPSDHVVILDTKTFSVVRTVLVEAPVKVVLPSPDGLHAVALLGQATGSQKPGGFSLIPLTTSLAPKIVGTDAPPQAVAVGASQALITVDGKDPVKNLPVHAVYLAQLPGFGTTPVTLASPPISTGIVTDPAASLGFVAQAHPEGRITFLDLVTGQPRTLTGFELAARVVQGD